MLVNSLVIEKHLMMKQKLKRKIEAAKLFRGLIEELKKSKNYLMNEKMKSVEELLKHFQFSFFCNHCPYVILEFNL